MPARRLLLERDRTVRLGGRALDILIQLVEHAGEVVGRDALFARAWPNLDVDDSNLKFQISGLRRVLGDGHAGNRFIATVPGRGYSFVGPIAFTAEPKPAAPPAAAATPLHNLPAQLTRLVGREEIVGKLAERLLRQRFLTIVGPGGIGKTSVALAAADELINVYEDGVWLIDLAPLADPRLVPSALATVLGCDIRSNDPVPRLVAALRDRRLLLVFDNCEHVIEAAATLAAAILKGAPGVAILATSREPLRVEGEYVQRLAPLASGLPSGHFGAADALAFPAIELFVERAAECLGEFQLTDADAPIVAEICRKLDGIPLAIELAAARMDAFGVRGLATHLEDRFPLLTGGRRSAPARHRTLKATLDWSYEVLSDPERTVFRRLAIFAGGSSLDAVGKVASDLTIPEREVVNLVADLIVKSLVVVEATAGEPHFRLLETTRAYARGKLAQSGERERLARRHAEYFRDLFERAETEWETRPTAEWLDDYAHHIDNLRAALDWAFSPEGDAVLGVELTAAAVPLWIQLSFADECRSRAERALAALEAGANRNLRREMKLQAALGISLIYTRGPSGPEVGGAWARAREIADSLDAAEYRLRSLWGLWSFHLNNARYRTALALTEEFLALANKRPAPIPGTPALGGQSSGDWLVGEVMIGKALHHLGDLKNARRHFERVLCDDVNSGSGSFIARFQLNQRVDTRASLALILLQEGFPDQAMRTAESNIEEARANGHVVSLCHALSLAACPIALWVGDLVASEHYARMLLDHSTRHGLAAAQHGGRRYQSVLLIKKGDIAAGLPLLRACLARVGNANVAFGFFTFVSEMAEAMARAGQVVDGLAAIEKALALSEQSEGRWLIVELLRVKGELLLMQDARGSAVAAEGLFRQALDGARRHGALSWELRAATSLAQMWREQGLVGEARELLSQVYGRFTEGFDTADLRAAKRFLDDLS